MDVFTVEAVAQGLPGTRAAYRETVRVPAMSVGVYVVPAGAVDGQMPHTEDELYHVVRGRGKFTSGHETRDVSAGATVFVPAHEPHRFHDVQEDLVVLVVFAPAETLPS